MRPKKLESRRVQVSSSAESKTVALVGGHISIPIVTISLQPNNSTPGEFRTTGRITAVSTTSVTIEFSSLFQGYLHLHAVSEL